MTEKRDAHELAISENLSRRSALKGAGAAAGLVLAPGFVRYSQAQSSEPIKIGFQAHRTGIGAAYGRWYEKITNAAVKLINEPAASMAARSRSSSRMTAPIRSAAPRWSANSPRSTRPTWSTARCSRMW